MMMMIDDDQWSMVIADHWYQPCINKPLGFWSSGVSSILVIDDITSLGGYFFSKNRGMIKNEYLSLYFIMMIIILMNHYGNEIKIVVIIVSENCEP